MSLTKMKPLTEGQLTQRGGDKPTKAKTYVFQVEVVAPPYQLEQYIEGSWALDDLHEVFQDAIVFYLENKMNWLSKKDVTKEVVDRQVAFNDAKRTIAEAIRGTIKYVGPKKKSGKGRLVQRGGDKPARNKTYIFQMEVVAPPYQCADEQRSVGSWAQDDIGNIFQDAIKSYLIWERRWMCDPTADKYAKKRQIAYNKAKEKIAEKIVRTLKFIGEKSV